MKSLIRREPIRLSRRSFVRGSTALITSSLLLPRKSRAWTHGGGGGGGYRAPAVHFDGTAILDRDGGLTGVSDTSRMILFMWINGLWQGFPGLDSDYLFYGQTTDNQGTKIGDESATFSSDSGGSFYELDYYGGAHGPIPPSSVWVPLLLSINFGFSAPNMRGAVYFSDTSFGVNSSQTGGPITLTPSSWYTAACASDSDTPSTLGDFSNVMCWFGNDIVQPDNTINEADRRNFFTSDGKAVNPSLAIAAYGQPSLYFAGDKDHFATNQGTGGSFTLTGTLTNASTSPSD